MNPPDPKLGPQQKRLAAYLDHVARATGHRDRADPFKNYCKGLLLPGERKSVEPLAARLAPGNVRRTHQSLHHLVADAPWSDEAVLRSVRGYALTAMRKREPVAAWIVGETFFPKKGRESVGVAWQTCRQSEKRENCQVAVSLSVCTGSVSLPVAFRLYLPENWCGDSARRWKTGVPEEIRFRTKARIALDQIRQAVEDEVPRGVVVAGEGYGAESQFLEGLRELPLEYAVGVPSSERVRPLALALPESAWSTVGGPFGSRAAAIRHRSPHVEEWLLIEWPEAAVEPSAYWLSNLPAETKLDDLVRIAKQNVVAELAFSEIQRELGLGHFEGRGWLGFHHHATLCLAAYGFLVAERSLFSPSLRVGELEIPVPDMPPKFRPRGAAGT